LTIIAQETINWADIETVNMGDGQLFVHKRDSAKTALDGQFRLIDGINTEYVDAFFNNGYAANTWNRYLNNKLRTITNYYCGYKHGYYAELNADGTNKITGNYLQGNKNGDWEEYSASGNVKQLETYVNGDLRERITYYVNGSEESVRHFLNNKEHGSELRYAYEDHAIRTSKNYVDGKQVGLQMQYYANTIADYIQISNYSERGKLEGNYVETYVATQSIKTQGNYRNGKRIGKWIYNSANIEADYSQISYYSDNGNLDGDFTETYIESKKTKTQGKYREGKKVGIWIYNNPKGKTIKTETYNDNGELLRAE
jgi:antitoxin component YwqK of YwqJK toxin-antitoxin module